MHSLPGGDLASLVTEKVTLSELETSRFTRQAFEGLQYLHKSGIIHSNIRVRRCERGCGDWTGVLCKLVMLSGVYSYTPTPPHPHPPPKTA